MLFSNDYWNVSMLTAKDTYGRSDILGVGVLLCMCQSAFRVRGEKNVVGRKAKLLEGPEAKLFRPGESFLMAYPCKRKDSESICVAYMPQNVFLTID
jgi:hypothetical protein